MKVRGKLALGSDHLNICKEFIDLFDSLENDHTRLWMLGDEVEFNFSGKNASEISSDLEKHFTAFADGAGRWSLHEILASKGTEGLLQNGSEIVERALDYNKGDEMVSLTWILDDGFGAIAGPEGVDDNYSELLNNLPSISVQRLGSSSPCNLSFDISKRTRPSKVYKLWAERAGQIVRDLHNDRSFQDFTFLPESKYMFAGLSLNLDEASRAPKEVLDSICEMINRVCSDNVKILQSIHFSTGFGGREVSGLITNSVAKGFFRPYIGAMYSGRVRYENIRRMLPKVSGTRYSDMEIPFAWVETDSFNAVICRKSVKPDSAELSILISGKKQRCDQLLQQLESISKQQIELL